MKKLTYEYLYNKYILENKTMQEIANENGMNIKTISKKLKGNNLIKSAKDIYKSQKNSLSNPTIRAKAEYNKKIKRKDNTNVNLNFIEESDYMDRLYALKKKFHELKLNKDEKTLYNDDLKIICIFKVVFRNTKKLVRLQIKNSKNFQCFFNRGKTVFIDTISHRLQIHIALFTKPFLSFTFF